jgi:hypothetical protein
MLNDYNTLFPIVRLHWAAIRVLLKMANIDGDASPDSVTIKDAMDDNDHAGMLQGVSAYSPLKLLQCKDVRRSNKVPPTLSALVRLVYLTVGKNPPDVMSTTNKEHIRDFYTVLSTISKRIAALKGQGKVVEKRSPVRPELVLQLSSISEADVNRLTDIEAKEEELKLQSKSGKPKKQAKQAQTVVAHHYDVEDYKRVVDFVPRPTTVARDVWSDFKAHVNSTSNSVTSANFYMSLGKYPREIVNAFEIYLASKA